MIEQEGTLTTDQLVAVGVCLSDGMGRAITPDEFHRAVSIITRMTIDGTLAAMVFARRVEFMLPDDPASDDLIFRGRQRGMVD